MTGGIGVDNPLVSGATLGLSSKAGDLYSKLFPGNLNLSYQDQADLEKYFAAAGDFRHITGENRAIDYARLVSPLRFTDVKQEQRQKAIRSHDELIQAFADATSGAQRREVMREWVKAGNKPMDLIRERATGKKQTKIYQNMDSEKRLRFFDMMRRR